MNASEGRSVVEWRGRLYLYGGTRGHTDALTSDVVVVQLDASAQRCDAFILPTQGQPPPPRADHAACLWRDRFMVVVGGCTVEAPAVGAKEDVVWFLDLEERTWHTVSVSGDAPLRRCNHTLCASSDRLVLFGGYPPGEGLDVRRLSAEHSRFYSVHELVLGSSTPVWECKPCSDGGVPPMLWGHTAVLSHRRLIVFGGVNVLDGRESATVWIWYCERMRWRPFESLRAPLPRAMHSAVGTPDGHIVVFGGVGAQSLTKYNDTWTLFVETGQWQELACGGAVPTARSGHASAVLSGRLVVVGGVTADQCRQADIHVLDVATGMWSPVLVPPAPDPPPSHGGRADPPQPVPVQYPHPHPPPPAAGSHLSPPRPQQRSVSPPVQQLLGYSLQPVRPVAAAGLDHIVPYTDDSGPQPLDDRSVDSAPPPPPPLPPMPSEAMSQAVQTDPLPTASASPPRRRPDPPQPQPAPPPPQPQPVLVPVESAEAQWAHAEAADLIQKQWVEIEALRSQLESLQSAKGHKRQAFDGVLLDGAAPAPPAPRISLTKSTLSDMMPRLALSVADPIPGSAPPRPGPAVMTRESTAAVVERRLKGGDLGTAWDGASPLLNPSLLPTAPVDSSRHTTQRRDLGLAAVQPTAAHALSGPPPGRPPNGAPQELLAFDPLSVAAAPASTPLPAHHPTRYVPPQSYAELLERTQQPQQQPPQQPQQQPLQVDVLAASSQVSPDSGRARAHKSPSLRKILSGEASMLSITHVDARRDAALQQV